MCVCVSVFLCEGEVGRTGGHLLYRTMHLKPCRELEFGARIRVKTKDDPIARYKFGSPDCGYMRWPLGAPLWEPVWSRWLEETLRRG